MPRPPLDGLIDDLYYLAGTSPYAPMTLPPAPSALLIVITMPTQAYEFGYPPETCSVGVHFKPWGLAPFLPMPAAELCDRPVTIEQVWGRPAIAELRDRLATATGPHEMLALLEDELMRRLTETAGLGLVRTTASPPPCSRSTPPGPIGPGRLAAARRLISYQSDRTRPANLRAPEAEENPRGQGRHVQLGVGGRLHRR